MQSDILKFLTALPIATFLVVFCLTDHVADSVFCTLAVASLCVVALPVILTRPLDVFHPFSLLALSVFLGTTGKAFYLVFSRSRRWYFLTEGQPVDSYLVAVLLIFGCCVCTTIGYFAVGNVQFSFSKLGHPLKQFSTNKLLILTALTIPVAVFATVDFARKTGFETRDGLSGISRKRSFVVDESATFGRQTSALGYHRLIAGTLPAAVCTALIIAICFQPPTSTRQTAWWLAGLCFCTACCLPFLASSRKSIIFLLLDILIVLSYSGRLRKHHLVFGLAAACSIGTIMLAIRAAGTGAFSDSRSNVVTRVADALFGTTNYLEITKTSTLYRSVPKILDHKHGETYLGVLYAPIPRVLYPEKPAVRPAGEFAEKAYGYSRAKGGSIPPGFVGETLWNFSTWSIWPVSLMYGGLLRLLYNSFVPFVRQSPRALLMYVVILLPVSFEFLGGSVSGSVLNVAQRLLFAIVMILLATEWRPTRRVVMSGVAQPSV